MAEYYALTYSSSLSHHGIKGQKWGVRRYRNYDGTLTAAGKKKVAKMEKYQHKLASKASRNASKSNQLADEANYKYEDLRKYGKNSKTYKRWANNETAQMYYMGQGAGYSSNEAALFAGATKAWAYADRNAAVNVASLMAKYSTERDIHISSAKEWTRRSENIMNYKVSDITSKKDLKAIYKNK